MKVSLIVPVYNEEETIPIFYDAVRNSHTLDAFDIEVIFINDGSSDKTEALITALADKDTLVKAIDFSRNFGKEAALFAGLDFSDGDVVIPIDVDLQDPIDVIPRLIEKYDEGYQVVLAKRSARQSDSFFKQKTAMWFYKVHNIISASKIEENVGDFRLMDREVVEAIKRLPERNLFMKGVLSWVGFNTAVISYERAPRVSGKTKFNGWRLWNFALEGITSFSTLPLRLWTYLGLMVFIFSFIYAGWIILNKLLFGNPVPGYPSIMVSILFLGSVQLIGIGVLGEYIGRIYIESKQRPRYIIKQKTDNKSQTDADKK